MPVREALRRLDSDGLVTLRPNRGAIVTGYSEDELVQVFEMCSVLEGFAASCATTHMGEVEIAEMSGLVRRLAQAEDSLDPDIWIQTHWDYHAYIARLSGRQKLAREIERMHILLEPYFRKWLTLGGSRTQTARSHEDLVLVFRRGDASLAEASMRSHVVEAVPVIVAGMDVSGA